MNEEKNSRRSFLKLAISAVALAPALRVASVFAEKMMPKSEKIKKKMINDSTAKRLNYVPNHAEAKAKKAAGDKGFKKYSEGEQCSNCKFFKADKNEPEWGKCTMAANRYVFHKGWCKSYRPDKK